MDTDSRVDDGRAICRLLCGAADQYTVDRWYDRRALMLSVRLSTAGMVATGIVSCTAWLSFGILAVVDADGTRVGVLPRLWLLALIILIAGSAAAALRLSWRVSLPLFLISPCRPPVVAAARP